MTQLAQFIKWQFRDFGRMFKSITLSKIAAVLIGGQLGSAFMAMHTDNKELLKILPITISLTILLFVLSMVVEIQWDRFKRDQAKIVDILKK